jgi:hypothetical protein
MLAGNSAPFIPTSISGLQLWLDADDSSTITLNGSNVSQWNDKSGNAYNFTQATAANQPARTLSGQNSKTVLTFATNDFLANTALDWGASASTLFIVGKEDNSAGTGYQNLFTTGTGATGRWGYGVAANAPTDSNVIGIFDIGEGLARFASAMTNTNADVLCFTSAGISSGSVTASLFKNGTADANNPVTRGTTTSAAGAQLGAAAAGSEAYFGTICEVILYNSQLSTTNRNKVEDYLKTKWATV